MAVQLDSTMSIVRFTWNRTASLRVMNATNGYIGGEHVPRSTCGASSDRHIGGIGRVLLAPASCPVYENHSRSSRLRAVRSEWRALCAHYLRQRCGQMLAPVPIREKRILPTWRALGLRRGWRSMSVRIRAMRSDAYERY